MPIQIKAADLLRRDLRDQLDVAPLMKGPIPKLLRSNIAGQYVAQEWWTPDGRRVPWAKNADWPAKGERSGGEQLGGAKKPGIATGALYEANVGSGPGGFVRSGPRSCVVGVEQAKFPYLPFVRGGTGAVIRTAPWIVRPRKLAGGKWGRAKGPQRYAMWWYIFLTFGITLSESKLREGIRIPTRPYGTKNPTLMRALTLLVGRHIAKGGR